MEYNTYNNDERNLQMLNVDFYHKSNGECSVREYLDSLTPKLRTKMLRSIMLLEEFGTGLRMPYSGAIGDGIFELRSIVGNDITRVLYFFVEGNTAILTNGFTKKTQKTPAGKIKKANLYRTDYYMKNNSKE